jgi:hypothetical protein
MERDLEVFHLFFIVVGFGIHPERHLAGRSAGGGHHVGMDLIVNMPLCLRMVAGRGRKPDGEEHLNIGSMPPERGSFFIRSDVQLVVACEPLAISLSLYSSQIPQYCRF